MISADPGLSQGRGGAWDHRRCGTHLRCSSVPRVRLQNRPKLSEPSMASSGSTAFFFYGVQACVLDSPFASLRHLMLDRTAPT